MARNLQNMVNQQSLPGRKDMALLSAYEEKALTSIEQTDVWLSVSEIGTCRLSTLNKLVEKGYLERIRRPGPYIPNESILFRLNSMSLSATG